MNNHLIDPSVVQGFTQLHFTPLEVLAIIEGVQKRLDKQFTAKEIERGVLKDVLIDDDYDLARVVSFLLNSLAKDIASLLRSNVIFQMCH